MFKLIVPIVLIITAGFMGFFEMTPLYKDIKVIKSENQRIDDALQKTKDIGEIAEDLRSKIESISASDITKLDAILPEDIDEIRFLSMLNSIARRWDLTLSQLVVASNYDNKLMVEVGDSKKAKPLNISFSVFAPYETFQSFLNELEQSLSLIDIDFITLSVPVYGEDAEEIDSYTYSVKLSTYWIE